MSKKKKNLHKWKTIKYLYLFSRSVTIIREEASKLEKLVQRLLF